eukprot:1074637-Pleurochrysis_carterae.AAC.1
MLAGAEVRPVARFRGCPVGSSLRPAGSTLASCASAELSGDHGTSSHATGVRVCSRYRET